MKYTYWQKRMYNAKRFSIDIAKVLTCLTLACTVSLTPCYAQQIITDGNTATSLNTNGTVTDVTTTTLKGSNAFNSFTNFNVDTGNTVNLVVPDRSDNLINIVTGEQTAINGVLNSIKHGQIGGNIFLANPNGIVVGSQGVVNVGSITAITPTADFTNNFFNGVGDPNDASVTTLLNGTVPINADATISVAGKINAITNVTLEAGTVTNYGEIYTNADFGPDIETGDIVNLNSLEYTEHHAPQNLMLENGEIKIKAVNELNQRGGIYAGGDIELTSNNDLIIGDSIQLWETYVSETYSGNGDIDLLGQHHVQIATSYITSGGELSITQNEYLSDHYNAAVLNSTITAASDIEINVLSLTMTGKDNTSGQGNTQIPSLLESGGNISINTEGIYADKLKAYGDIVVNSLSDATISAESTNGNIEINCTNFELNNLRPDPNVIFDPNMGITTDYALKAAGDITINAQYNFIVDYADIRAGNDITINAALNPELSLPDEPYLAILGNSNIISTGGDISLNYESNYLFFPDYLRYGIAGDYQLGYLSSPTIEAVGNIDIAASSNIDITGGVTLIGDNITLTSPSIDIGIEMRQYYDINDPETNDLLGVHYNIISPSGAIIEANSLNITQLPSPPTGDPMYPYGLNIISLYDTDITTTGTFSINRNAVDNRVGFMPSSINAGSFSSNFIAPNSDINLQNSAIGNLDHITIGGAPFNPGNITLVNGSLWGDVTTTGTVSLTNPLIYKENNLNLHSDAGITINTTGELHINSADISTNGLLTLNADDILNNGIIFAPDSITAGSLSSNFLAQNGDIIINTNHTIQLIQNPELLNRIGNLDNITIGGAPLNPTNININAEQMVLSGDITTTGNINMTGKWLQLDDTASLNAGGNISIDPTGRLDFNAAIINTSNQLTINGGNITDNGLIFTPESIVAGSLVSDFLTQNGAITLTSNESLNIANLNAITIGGSGLNITDLTLTAGETATIGGAITVSNNIDLIGKIVEVSAGSTINAGNNLTLDPTESIHVYGGDITVTNLLTLNRGSSNILGLALKADSITAGSLSSDFLVQNGDLDLSDIAGGDIYLLNLDNNFTIGGNPINLNNFILENEYYSRNLTLGNIELSGYLEAYSQHFNLCR